MRYLCDGAQRGKQLQAAELQALWAAGRRVGLVWENDQTDPDGGYDQGVAFGSRARQQARALGFPDTVPIYAAVDKRLTAQTRPVAVEYQRGFRDGAGLSRPYGEGALIDACVDAGITDCGWMPETWGTSQHLALVQLVSSFDGVVTVNGTDANRVERPDWGGFHPSDTPPPQPEEDEVNLANCIIAIELAYAAHGAGGDNAGKAYWQKQVADAAPEGRDAVLALMISKLG